MAVSKFPVTKQPYDATLEENMSMYDKLPYKRNEDMCNASTLALETGNLIKYYRCTEIDSIDIKTQDEHFSAIADAHIQAYEKELLMLHQKFPTIYGSLELENSSENPPFLEEDSPTQEK